MANRPKGFGMTAELADKRDKKYDLDVEGQVVEWIVSMLNCERPASGKDAVHAWLKDGQVLCNLINIIQPGSIRKINTNKMAFKQMENIGNFLAACEKAGVKKLDTFQTVDLYECANMPQVLAGLMALGRRAQALGHQGIGPKEAEANKREFTEEQMREGRNVIGLQMGSNKGASQAGQSFGKARMIID